MISHFCGRPPNLPFEDTIVACILPADTLGLLGPRSGGVPGAMAPRTVRVVNHRRLVQTLVSSRGRKCAHEAKICALDAQSSVLPAYCREMTKKARTWREAVL